MSAVLIDPQKKNGVETVKLIEKAALEHLRAVGVRKFSPTTVAAMVPCAVGTMYRYWPTAEALIEAVAPGACRAWENVAVALEIIDRDVESLVNLDPAEIKHVLKGGRS